MSRKLLLLMCFVFVIGLCISAKAAIPIDDWSFTTIDQEPQCWEEQTKLLASDGAAQDRLGLSVSVSGDYAVVGAPSDEDNGYASGSAYIFVRDGDNWGQQAKLLPSDGQEGDHFGDSVSISGDYCIIGAHLDDDNGYASGSAYIFVQDGNSWVQQAKLLASDGAGYDYFGRPVSICGDYAIVGAIGDDDNGIRSGSAYIFVRDGNSWVQQAKLTASDGQEYDYFGSSVSINGDYCLVGAYLDEDNGYDSGSAYIFVRDGENWLQQAKLLASDGEAWDNFGYSVSMSGDYCIIGAHQDDDNGIDSGSAYIFEQEGVVWSEKAKLTASDGAAGDWFGISVSVSGDYAIVGDSNDTDNGYASGSAYIFVREGDSWLQQAKLLPSDGEEWDLFGNSVSVSGNYCVVGALFDDDNGNDSGSAYVFSETFCEPNNAPPIANAGPDQTLYVPDYNTLAEVTLDGSGSYDPDEDELTYAWFLNDSNDPNGPVIATGVSPTIFLPIGEHTIELIVDDGRDDSEPDQVVITVVCTPGIETTMELTPQMLNCKSKGKWLKAHVTLPEEIYPEDIDVNTPAVADPPGVESEFIEVNEYSDGYFDVQIYFERQGFCQALSESEDGLLEVTVTGSLTDGRKFQGSDTIKLKSKPWQHRIRKDIKRDKTLELRKTKQ